jgi:hypothetical protein
MTSCSHKYSLKPRRLRRCSGCSWPGTLPAQHKLRHGGSSLLA